MSTIGFPNSLANFLWNHFDSNTAWTRTQYVRDVDVSWKGVYVSFIPTGLLHVYAEQITPSYGLTNNLNYNNLHNLIVCFAGMYNVRMLHRSFIVNTKKRSLSESYRRRPNLKNNTNAENAIVVQLNNCGHKLILTEKESISEALQALKNSFHGTLLRKLTYNLC